jgi:hypothetical protein|tara:strand:- start:10862 stop:11755 length:894 start_codon:yes stop_codon:yes gene_type:complete
MLCILKTVIQIFGTSFSGSSLLNQLLNSQNGIRGLGEVVHYYMPMGKDGCCVQCKEKVVECPFFKDINPKKFYADCLAKYKCDVVVDSSKSIRMMEVLDPDLRYIRIFLSKTPHEYAYSCVQHSQEKNAIQWFAQYSVIYKNLMNSYKNHEAKYSGIYHADTVKLCYRSLALHPKKIIESLCSLCGVSFDSEAFSRWYTTDSHIIGGNLSLRAQNNQSEKFFQKDSKYKGKLNTIFLDQHWRNDEQFIDECKRAYRIYGSEFDEILQHLGQPSVQELVQDLESGFVPQSTLSTFIAA